MRRRKGRHKEEGHEEEISESWLLPYSDLMTLLLALFIVLSAISSVDAQKFQAISKVFNDIFTGGTGTMEYENSIPEDKINLEEEKPEENGLTKNEQIRLQEIQKKIRLYISDKGLTNQLNTSLTSEGLLVTIRDSVLFDSGSADVRDEDRKIANEISDLLISNPPHNVIISGHTDNVPQKGAKYSSNWELSVMRAINFMKILLENPNLDPSMFSAKGYGEYQPIASNDTPEGRAKNRRVEILILPNNE